MNDSCSTAAFWTPPVGLQPAEEAPPSEPFSEILGPDAMVRVGALMSAWRAVHPVALHFYLAAVGTDPPAQGAGLATAVLWPVLERCDAEGIPAYLESTKETNVGFYERRGFRVTGEIAPPPDGPTQWCMWRDPLG